MPCVEVDQGMTLLKAGFSIEIALGCWGLGPGQGAESVFVALSCVNAAKPVQSQLLGSELRLLDSTRIGSPSLGLPTSIHQLARQ